MNILNSILKFLPYVLGAVITVEQNVSAPGVTKKQIVLNSILGVAQIGEQVPNQPLAEGISGLIDTTVSALKAGGIFGPSPSTVTPISGSGTPAPATPAPALQHPA